MLNGNPRTNMLRVPLNEGAPPSGCRDARSNEASMAAWNLTPVPARAGVVLDLVQQIGLGLRQEAKRNHLAMARALAKTLSAARA